MQTKVYTHETPLVHDILGEFGGKPWIRIERNNVGKAYGPGGVRRVIELLKESLRLPLAQMPGKVREALQAASQMRLITFGTPSDPDIRGLLACAPLRGVCLVIECKVNGKKLRDDQENRASMYRGMGAVHISAWQVEDVYKGLAEAGVPEELLRG